MNPSDSGREDAAKAVNLLAGDVRAPLNFVVRQDTKPYFISSALTGGDAEFFFETEAQTVTIRDVRPVADSLSIDMEGFELYRHETSVEDLYDDAAVEGVYSREIEALLKAATGASRVVVFDHTRRADGPRGAVNPDGLRGPAYLVHVDYTALSGPERVRNFLGTEEVDRVLGSGGRIVQINVWRPITGPVQRSPLALAEAESIKTEELIATEQRFPDRVGEIYLLARGSDQRWCWLSGMDRNETLLIKGWDSLDDGRARFTPHGAFPVPDQDPEAPTRESIETRTYLVFDG
ncbi:MAG: CmcJ/NvfI family oxidoreductase [Alphaproteobacteria bacterium]|mgnify:FL=1|jgi:hypothetical protein|nr:CmcJ/NvfI family oxidoreductase [Alphaproteobacteria bacterium]